jgi:hypothetical protein
MAASPLHNRPDSRAAPALAAALHMCSTKLAKETGGIVDDELLVDARAVLEEAGWEPPAQQPDPAAAGRLGAVLRRVVARLRRRYRDVEPGDPEGDWSETSRGLSALEAHGFLSEDADDIDWRACDECGGDWFGTLDDDYICPRCRARTRLHR